MENMIKVLRYNNDFKEEWDNLIAKSKIDTFLFQRDYMDYHSDRFVDCSFLIYKKDNLEAVMPGNIKENKFYSHQGLTFGGIISTQKFTTTDTLLAFEMMNSYLKTLGLIEVIYKPAPYIYQLIPSQEDLYTLFKLKATKIGCGISSCILQTNRIRFQELRRRGVKKAMKEGLKIIETNDFEHFWAILNNNLKEKFGIGSVHSLIEINQLKKIFPENIKLYIAELDFKTHAGCVLFISNSTIHVQYISASQEGKINGALDLLFDELINNLFANYKYFDFGISTENLGEFLNENLIFQKEGFGGRGVVYETYSYKL